MPHIKTWPPGATSELTSSCLWAQIELNFNVSMLETGRMEYVQWDTPAGQCSEAGLEKLRRKLKGHR